MKTTFHRQAAAIDWYCESRGTGSPIVLIPSGEGDCGSFEKTADSLAREFSVLTFDMPGFSRSSDPPDFGTYSLARAASEVATLIEALGIAPATFYGCSSGGQVALGLAADYPHLVRNIVVHEVALPPKVPGGPIADLVKLSDEVAARVCADIFRNLMNENAAAWDALGDDYHHRLKRNYVTWVRRYIASKGMREFSTEELQRRTVTWTIGGLTPAAAFFDNVMLANSAGIPIGLLMCRHFPQVSIPDMLAEHIGRAARA